jgi:hypothetical protein
MQPLEELYIVFHLVSRLLTEITNDPWDLPGALSPDSEES